MIKKIGISVYSKNDLIKIINQFKIEAVQLPYSLIYRRFEKIFYEYQGFIGYFIILQSMILRTPKFIKKKTYKFFTFIDIIFSKLNSKFLSPSYIIIYKKRD